MKFMQYINVCIKRFLALKDTPSTYSGQSGKYVAVNLGENALEFVDAPTSGDEFLVHLKFEVVEAIVYTVPYDCKFTAMIHQQVNTPTLSTALNTNMAQYDDLTVTPDATGLVTLTGIWL
jgi:hypothetical protein